METDQPTQPTYEIRLTYNGEPVSLEDISTFCRLCVYYKKQPLGCTNLTNETQAEVVSYGSCSVAVVRGKRVIMTNDGPFPGYGQTF